MTAKDTVYRHLREFTDHFTPPPPFSRHTEISGDNLVMMMSPAPRHDQIIWRLGEQLRPQLGDGLIPLPGGDMEDAGLGVLRRPDLLVLPLDATEREEPIQPRDVLLAVEVVSPSNPENDYTGKLRDYPAMGVPHYLIVDPRDGTAQHHWHPVSKEGRPVYENHVAYSFGDTIPVGDWTIDTAPLPRYGQEPAT